MIALLKVVLIISLTYLTSIENVLSACTPDHPTHKHHNTGKFDGYEK